ncbi:MAG: 5-formyltetrahydrofolate cyclo-ligase [Pyrinomonadaceae bacterium]
MTKAELRKSYLAKQQALPPAMRIGESSRISEAFFRNFDLSGVRCLHCFVPIKKFNEVDTAPILDRLWSDFPDMRIAVPRIRSGENVMDAVAFDRTTSLQTNPWGIDEPAKGEAIDNASIDLVLVPAVCFDIRGHRVGYGKGFYDRFLASTRPGCQKIGLSFFEPAQTIDDIGRHDVSVDRIVTPKTVYLPLQ